MTTASVPHQRYAPQPFNPHSQNLPLHLQANQGSLPGKQLGWLRPTTLDTPVSELRRRFKEDDYLFVKNLIPRDVVLAMRSHYFSQYSHTGLMKPNTSPVDGIYSGDDPASHRGIGGGDPTGDDLKALVQAHATDQYLRFVKHENLRAFVRELMGWDEEVLLKRTMLRHNVPHGESTGVHYDKLFLRGGDAFFLTAWVPIGDISPDGGGLIYLEDSSQLGQAIENDFSERAKDFTPEEKISAFNANMTDTGILSNHPAKFEEEHRHIAEKVGQGDRGYRWLVTNYQAGDVVFHHPCIVHASCSNEDPEGRIRVSTDLRFYDKQSFEEGVEIQADKRWTNIWEPGDGL